MIPGARVQFQPVDPNPGYANVSKIEVIAIGDPPVPIAFGAHFVTRQLGVVDDTGASVLFRMIGGGQDFPVLHGDTGRIVTLDGRSAQVLLDRTGHIASIKLSDLLEI